MSAHATPTAFGYPRWMAEKLRFQCDMGWEKLTPLAGGRRHCGQCDHAVHDLTRFTRREAVAFRNAHPRACVHVTIDADTGELVFAPERRRLPVGGAAIAAMLTLGCGNEASSAEANLGPPAVEVFAEPASHPLVDEPAAHPPEGEPASHPLVHEPALDELAPDEVAIAPELDPAEASSDEVPPPSEVAPRRQRRRSRAAAPDADAPRTTKRQILGLVW